VPNVRRAVGDAGEEAVAEWYRARGYEVVARNWRVRSGEVDLIVRRGATVVFCEVKTRRGDRYGLPVEAVTRAKQARIRAVAAQWLRAAAARAPEVRFDVASVRPNGRGWDVEVIAGAF
jgi:putative endonuclease